MSQLQWFHDWISDMDPCIKGERLPETIRGWLNPFALFFNWNEDQEPSKEVNWKGFRSLPEKDPIDFIWSLITEMAVDMAEVGIYPDETWDLHHVALLDCIFGLLVQEAGRHKSDVACVNVPAVHIVGDEFIVRRSQTQTRAMVDFIKFSRQMLVENVLFGDVVKEKTGLEPWEVTSRLRALFPCPNLVSTLRVDDIDYEIEPFVNVDCGFWGERGLARLESLLRLCGRPPNWSVDPSWHEGTATLMRVMIDTTEDLTDDIMRANLESIHRDYIHLYLSQEQ